MRHREYTIECDGDNCEGGDREVVEMCETRKEAEQQARIEGWTIGKQDLCPACRRGATSDLEEEG